MHCSLYEPFVPSFLLLNCEKFHKFINSFQVISWPQNFTDFIPRITILKLLWLYQIKFYQQHSLQPSPVRQLVGKLARQMKQTFSHIDWLTSVHPLPLENRDEKYLLIIYIRATDEGKETCIRQSKSPSTYLPTYLPTYLEELWIVIQWLWLSW